MENSVIVLNFPETDHTHQHTYYWKNTPLDWSILRSCNDGFIFKATEKSSRSVWIICNNIIIITITRSNISEWWYFSYIVKIVLQLT